MRTNDGIRLLATTAAGQVAELHAKSHAPAIDDVAFMAETVKRVYEQTGTFINDKNPETFIAGLIKLGLLFE